MLSFTVCVLFVEGWAHRAPEPFSLESESYDRLIVTWERLLITITTTAALVMRAMLNMRRSGFIQRCEQLYSHHSAYFKGPAQGHFFERNRDSTISIRPAGKPLSTSLVARCHTVMEQLPDL